MNEERAEKISDSFNRTLNRISLVLLGLVFGILGGKSQAFREAEAQGKPNPLTGQCAPTAPENRLKVGYLTEVKPRTKIRLYLMSGRTVTGWLVQVKDGNGTLVLNVGTPEEPNHAFFKPTSLEGCDPNPIPQDDAK